MMAMKALFPEPKACGPSLFTGIGEVGVGDTTVPLVVALGHNLVAYERMSQKSWSSITYPDPVGIYADASVPMLVCNPWVSVE